MSLWKWFIAGWVFKFFVLLFMLIKLRFNRYPCWYIKLTIEINTTNTMKHAGSWLTHPFIILHIILLTSTYKCLTTTMESSINQVVHFQHPLEVDESYWLKIADEVEAILEVLDFFLCFHTPGLSQSYARHLSNLADWLLILPSSSILEQKSLIMPH